MIHIQGYGYLPNQQIYFRLLLFIILAGIIAVWVSPVAMIISPILYIAWQYKARNWLKQFQHYPEHAIFRKVAVKNQGRRWFRLRYDFDFYSPYPLADCLNMLLNYSIVGDYENAEGIHKSAYVSQSYLATVTESYEGMYSFSVKKVNKKGNVQAETIGKLESVGYRTRVSGTNTPNQDWMVIAFVLVICIVLMFISSLGVWLFIFFSILGYVEYQDNIQTTGKYAQKTLGSKGGRKDKKDVADE